MNSFLSTLPELGSRLWRIVLINGGVKLVSLPGPAQDALVKLAESGVSILVCGTCLGHFGLLEAKAVGETSNMMAVTAPESMPPERCAPRGTSATRRERTASVSRWRNSSARASVEPESFGRYSSSQYLVSLTRPFRQSSVWAAGRLWMPRKPVMSRRATAASRSSRSRSHQRVSASGGTASVGST